MESGFTMPSDGYTTVIAEAGVNHNGSPDMALRLVDAAAAGGADIVKFQTFKAAKLATAAAPKASYQVDTTGDATPQLAMLEALELDAAAHERIRQHCEERGIEFMSTPFDEESLAFLANGMRVKRIKIGSGDLTNAPLLLAAGRTGLPVILSTGMAAMDDVEAALGALAFGYAGEAGAPSREAFRAACAQGQDTLRARVTLLHCTTAYPTPPHEVNLLAMQTLRERFGLTTGYSDHTAGIAVAIAAVAMGAAVIEKHVTLDRSLPGPDHRASIEPDALMQMIAAIRTVEAARGDGEKRPGATERENIAAARKSLVALCPIRPGEAFSPANLGVKRPGTGLSPFDYWDRLGRPASRAYAPDELIE